MGADRGPPVKTTDSNGKIHYGSSSEDQSGDSQILTCGRWKWRNSHVPENLVAGCLSFFVGIVLSGLTWKATCSLEVTDAGRAGLKSLSNIYFYGVQLYEKKRLGEGPPGCSTASCLGHLARMENSSMYIPAEWGLEMGAVECKWVLWQHDRDWGPCFSVSAILAC